LTPCHKRLWQGELLGRPADNSLAVVFLAEWLYGSHDGPNGFEIVWGLIGTHYSIRDPD